MTYPEQTYNQRQWIIQRQRPKRCNKQDCGKRIVFLKDASGRTFPCDAIKVRETKDGRRIMEESGLVTTIGERVGWPVHECSIRKLSDESEE